MDIIGNYKLLKSQTENCCKDAVLLFTCQNMNIDLQNFGIETKLFIFVVAILPISVCAVYNGI